MLNILANKDDIEIQDGVSGIAKKWNKSAYNIKLQAIESMDDLIKNTKSKYILISYMSMLPSKHPTQYSLKSNAERPSERTIQKTI